MGTVQHFWYVRTVADAVKLHRIHSALMTMMIPFISASHVQLLPRRAIVYAIARFKGLKKTDTRFKHHARSVDYFFCS
jgi:hypothetical protein